MVLVLVSCSKKDKDNGDGNITFYGNITIGQYKGVEVTKVDTTVTDEDIENKIEDFLYENREAISVTDRTDVRNGDTIVFDYIGKIDDVAFDGGTAYDAELEIGSGNFIPGFEEQIIGFEIGQTGDINVTFPDPYYNNEDMSGKEAVFTITINDIVGYDVPEFNDGTVALYSDYATVEEYKAALIETMTEENETEAQSQMYDELFEKIIEGSTISDIPDEVMAKYVDNAMYTYEYYASMYGMSLDDFVMTALGTTTEMLNYYLDIEAEYYAKQQLVLREVIRLEKIKVDEARYQEYIEELAANYEFETGADFEAQYGREMIEENLLLETAYKFLTDSMIIMEG